MVENSRLLSAILLVAVMVVTSQVRILESRHFVMMFLVQLPTVKAVVSLCTVEKN